MSVKHPVETFFKLLFENSKWRAVYASFPITRTRPSPERRGDIDHFRKSLRETGAIVVDPLTIDELRMGAYITDASGNKQRNPQWYELREVDKFKEYQSKRWPITDSTIEPPAEYARTPFAGLSELQIDSVVDGILAQVVDRDFRLVSQCGQLVAYRPFYPDFDAARSSDVRGDPLWLASSGVTREIDHALHLELAVWAFHPRCDYHLKQDEDFFEQAARWDRVTRFPAKSKLTSLTGDDVTSGFDEMIEKLKAELAEASGSKERA